MTCGRMLPVTGCLLTKRRLLVGFLPGLAGTLDGSVVTVTNGTGAWVCLKGRALWGQTQGGYKAVGARCKIGWGAVTGGWNRVGVALGLRTCLRVELKEELWGGGGGHPPSLQAKPWTGVRHALFASGQVLPSRRARRTPSPPPLG